MSKISSQVKQIKWKDHSSTLAKSHALLFENCSDFDAVVISSDGKEFNVHQAVLSSGSDFFFEILREVPAGIVPTIYIPDANSSVLESIFAFIYTGEISIASECLMQILDICHLLKIKGGIENGITINQISSDEILAEEHQDQKELVSVAASPANASEEFFPVEYLEYDVSNDIELTEIEEQAEDDDDVKCEDELSELDEENQMKSKRKLTRAANVETVLNEVTKGKTIHQLSVEYNLPRSTLYHRFRKNINLKQSYRSERRTALDNAVRCVMEERMSLKKASDRFNLPKTAIWRELRKYNQYQPPSKELPQERLEAQNEILMGKSLTSISVKYGIPMTTLHRDKKRLSSEGKLPELYRVKDRTENSEYGRRLEQALQKCRQGMSQYQAAKMFNIPKATMWRYAHALLKTRPNRRSSKDDNENAPEIDENDSFEFNDEND